jgi:uncharacterized membrane protein YedE/YeeE
LTFGMGLVIGVCFGVVVQRSRFCMLAAVSNLVLLRDSRQMNTYGIALGFAVLATQLLQATGWVDIAESAYRGPSLDWAGAIGGGLMFGFGTALAGGCAGRTVTMVGEGNVGAGLTLIAFAAGAAAAQFGALEPTRLALTEATAVPLTASHDLLPPPGATAEIALGFLCLAAAVWFWARTQRAGSLFAGALIGTLVAAGWWASSHAMDEFALQRPESLTFSGPLARLATALWDRRPPDLNFGLGLLGGTWLGALGSAWSSHTLRWVLPPRARVVYHVTGGALMGIGAMFAGGCNIGQGLTGMSTLAPGSLMATVAIFCGMWAGVRWLARLES